MGISREQALDCFRSDDLIGLGMEADRVRRRLHPEGVVSYTVRAELDPASLADHAHRGEEAENALFTEAERAIGQGATSLSLRASAAALSDLEELIASLKRRFVGLWVDLAAAHELFAIAQAAGMRLDEAILRLRAAGLDSISGAGQAAQFASWLEAHHAAHRAGMSTAAQLVFGAGETAEQRVAALEAVRDLQAETGGFIEFTPLGWLPPSGRELDGTTAVESLRTLAIARMMLENVANVQMSPVSGSLKVRQTGLRFGANDAGAVLVGRARNAATEEDLRRIIRDSGFRPAQRDTPYRTIFLN